ncbi:MAG: hypothetical protein ABI895_31365 [Deltaproteobacteria bacterium]
MNRPEMSRPMTLRRWEGVLCATIALASVACSGLADGSETWCDTDGQGLAGCGTGGSGDGPGDPGPWWCLDQPVRDPDFTPMKPAALVLPVLEWSTRQPLIDQGLTATLCPTGDPSCARPLSQAIPIRAGTLGGAVQLPPGAAGVPVFEGFDGFIKFDVVPDPAQVAAGGPPDPEQQFVSDYYYLNGIIAGGVSQGPPILMFQRRFRSVILAQSFPTVVDQTGVIAKGALAFGVYDCNGQPVNDAKVVLTSGGQPAPDVIPFRLPASRIPDAQPIDQDLYTQSSGAAGFLNVPIGFVAVTAYQRDGTYIGKLQLGSVGGQLTIGSVRPDFARKADITGSLPISNDTMGTGN